MPELITAADMARAAKIDPKTFRAALRRANLRWHRHDDPWEVVKGGPKHADMQAVLATLTNGRAASIAKSSAHTAARPRGRAERDEHYVIDLCDQILGERASRGHRFDFLRGDAAPGRIGRCLPVDAYYERLSLVVEYRECQHSEAAFFDRRATVSSVGRGEQRALYDQRRRDVLPRFGIRLVELDYSEFAHDGRKRLLRTLNDRAVVELRIDVHRLTS